MKRFLSILIVTLIATLIVSPISANEATLTCDANEAVACINDKGYVSLNDAISDVKDGETIIITKDILNASGISVKEGSNFVIDFQNHKYVLVGPGAGSLNTETNAFQFLKDSTIVMKNGYISYSENVKGIKRIIQNYANLTLDNMEFNAINQVGGEDYALSFNNGTTVIKNQTRIIQSNGSNIAFDVCKFSSYPSAKVIIDESFIGYINGTILYDVDENATKDSHSLVINGCGHINDIKVANENNVQAIELNNGSYGNKELMKFVPNDKALYYSKTIDEEILSIAKAEEFEKYCIYTSEIDGRKVYFDDKTSALELIKDETKLNPIEVDFSGLKAIYDKTIAHKHYDAKNEYNEDMVFFKNVFDGKEGLCSQEMIDSYKMHVEFIYNHLEIAPYVIKGNEAIWLINSNEGLSFITNAKDYSELVLYMYENNEVKEIDKKYYTYNDKGEVTLSKEYLNTLNKGEYRIRILAMYNDSYKVFNETTFKVVDKKIVVPPTGVTSTNYFIPSVILGAGILLVMKYNKKYIR